MEKHPKCISACKRFVTDNLMTEHEVTQLQDMARKIFHRETESSEIYHLGSNSLDDITTKGMDDTIKVNFSLTVIINHRLLNALVLINIFL